MEKKAEKKEIQKKQGMRLKECREWRELSQQEIAEIVGYDVKYISMLETGARPIDWDKAYKFADALSVNPEYIMCRSDNLAKKHTFEHSAYASIDSTIMQLIICNNHEIQFVCIPYYQTTDAEKKEKLILNYSHNAFEHFSFDNPICQFNDGETIRELIIEEVIIDNKRISFAHFAFVCTQINDYVDFTINRLYNSQFDYDMFRAGRDAALSEITTFNPPENLSYDKWAQSYAEYLSKKLGGEVYVGSISDAKAFKASIMEKQNKK